MLNKIIKKHFINNEFVDSVSKQTFQTINPATEEVIASVQRGDEKDIDLAVKAARGAFTKWCDVSGPDRRDLLLKLADSLAQNQQYLAEIESLDNGKPTSIARDIDIMMAIKHLKYFAGWADKLPAGKTINVENTSAMAFTLHEPIGVVGGIIPWNFPILMFIWKIGKWELNPIPNMFGFSNLPSHLSRFSSKLLSSLVAAPVLSNPPRRRL